MTKLRRIGTVTLVGLCVGATVSAFTASGASVRWSHCNHPQAGLDAKLDRLEAKLDKRADKGKDTSKVEARIDDLQERLAESEC